MAASISYEFYSETYGGGLSEAAFGDSLPAALRLLRRLCDGVVPEEGSEDFGAWQRAVCAACDAFAEYGEGQLDGFTIGEFRTMRYQGRGTTGTEIATAAAIDELAGTSLLFCGVR